MVTNYITSSYNKLYESLADWTSSEYPKVSEAWLETRYQFILDKAVELDFTSARSAFFIWGKKALSNSQKEEVLSILGWEEFEAFLDSLEKGHVKLTHLESILKERPDVSFKSLLGIFTEETVPPEVMSLNEKIGRKIFPPLFKVYDPALAKAPEVISSLANRASSSMFTKLAFTASWKLYKKASSLTNSLLGGFTKKLEDLSFENAHEVELLRKMVSKGIKEGHFSVEDITSFFKKFPHFSITDMARLYKTSPDEFSKHLKNLNESYFLKNCPSLPKNQVTLPISIESELAKARDPYYAFRGELFLDLDEANISPEQKEVLDVLNKVHEKDPYQDRPGWLVSNLTSNISALVSTPIKCLLFVIPNCINHRINPLAQESAKKIDGLTSSLIKTFSSFANEKDLRKFVNNFYQTRSIVVPDPKTWKDTLFYPVLRILATIGNLWTYLKYSVFSWATKRSAFQLIENHARVLLDPVTIESALSRSLEKMAARLQKQNQTGYPEITLEEKREKIENLEKAYYKTKAWKIGIPSVYAWFIKKGLKNRNRFIGDEKLYDKINDELKRQISNIIKAGGQGLSSALPIENNRLLQNFSFEENLPPFLLDYLASDVIDALTETLNNPLKKRELTIHEAGFAFSSSFFRFFTESVISRINNNKNAILQRQLKTAESLIGMDKNLRLRKTAIDERKLKPKLSSELYNQLNKEKSALKKAYYNIKDKDETQASNIKNDYKVIKKQFQAEQKRLIEEAYQSAKEDYQSEYVNKLETAKTYLKTVIDQELEAINNTQKSVDTLLKKNGVICNIFSEKVLPLQKSIQRFSKETLEALYPTNYSATMLQKRMEEWRNLP